MTVGEVMALLCKQASDEDMYLMAKDVYLIQIDDEGVFLYFTDGNTKDYFIKSKSEED